MNAPVHRNTSGLNRRYFFVFYSLLLNNTLLQSLLFIYNKGMDMRYIYPLFFLAIILRLSYVVLLQNPRLYQKIILIISIFFFSWLAALFTFGGGFFCLYICSGNLLYINDISFLFFAIWPLYVLLMIMLGKFIKLSKKIIIISASILILATSILAITQVLIQQTDKVHIY